MYKSIFESSYRDMSLSFFLLIPVFTGIFFANFLTIKIEIILFFLFFSFLFLIYQIKNLRINYRLEVLSIFLFFWIQFQFFIQNPLNDPTHFIYHEEKNQIACGVFVQMMKSKINTNQAVLQLELLRDASSVYNTNGDFLLKYPSLSTAQNFEIGDRICFPFEPQKIKESIWQSNFDYRSFLEKKGIFREQFVSIEKIYKIKENKINFFQKIAKIRYAAVDRLQENFSQEKAGFLAALLLGDRRFLDKKIQETFMQTGAVHVLAVSGLHIGFFKMMLDFLLKFFIQLMIFLKILKPLNWKLKKKLNSYISIFTLTPIWLYVILTGGSEAAIRAGVMMSILAGANFFKLPIQGLKLVIWALLLCLLFQPNWAFQIGFQLSFGAVLGIVLLQKTYKSFLMSKNKILSFLGESTAIGLSAQIGILPLALFYFQKLNVLFLFSNPLVLLLVSFLLPLGLFFIFFEKYFSFLKKIIDFLLDFLFYFLHKIENLSFLNLSLSLFSISAVFCLYFIFYFVFLLFKRKNIKFLFFIGVIFSILCVLEIQARYDQKTQLSLINYKKKPVFLIENGFEKHLFVQKKSVQIIEDQYLNQKIQQEKIKVHILEGEEKTLWFAYKNELLMIGKQKILFFDQNTGNDFSKIDLDILVDENTAKGSNNTSKQKSKRKFVLQGQKENHELVEKAIF